MYSVPANWLVLNWTFLNKINCFRLLPVRPHSDDRPTSGRTIVHPAVAVIAATVSCWWLATRHGIAEVSHNRTASYILLHRPQPDNEWYNIASIHGHTDVCIGYRRVCGHSGWTHYKPQTTKRDGSAVEQTTTSWYERKQSKQTRGTLQKLQRKGCAIFYLLSSAFLRGLHLED